MSKNNLTRRQFSLAIMSGAVSLKTRVGNAGMSSASGLESTQTLASLTLTQAASMLKARRTSSAALVQSCLQRIVNEGVKTNAFITVLREQALAQARVLDAEAAANWFRSPLHGIPIAIKDCIDTAGVRTTMASALFADRVPKQDAEVVHRLQSAGAIVIGKTNLGELCESATAAISHFGPVRNPWALDRISGGSSGGSGAALAANCCYGALGTDSGGSVRIPAAYCGVVALKPTYGLVPERGILSRYLSFDTCGPMARSVEDVALLLDAIAGYDALDITSVDHPKKHYREWIRRPVSGLRVGVPRKPYFEDLDPEIEKSIEAALSVLGNLTRSIKDVALPPLDHYPKVGIADAEYFDYHHRIQPQDYAERVTRGLVIASPILSSEKCGDARDTYMQGRWDLQQFRLTADQVFSEFDVVALPTMKDMPARIEDVLKQGEGSGGGDARIIDNTQPFNIYGWPAISLPCGFSSSGMPIGLMIAGPKFSEGKLLALAHAYEAAARL